MNNESRTPRKEVIKNITIVLLAVLLVLTFFSNTIMNYTLPQVSATYVSQGNISEQIRGSGTVNPAVRNEVKTTRTGEIKTVLVKAGDTVNAGDVLFEYVPPEESSQANQGTDPLETLKSQVDAKETELDNAIKSLETLKDDHNKAVLKAGTDSTYAAKLTEIKNAEKELEDMKKQLEDTRTGKANINTLTEKYNAAKDKAEELTTEKSDLQTMLSSVDTEDMLDLPDKYADRLTAAKKAVTDAEKAYNEAKKKYDDALANVPTSATKDQIVAKQNEIEMAQATLDGYYTALYNADPEDDTSSIWVSINTQQKTIENLERELASLRTDSVTETALKTKLELAEKKMNKCEKSLNTAKESLAGETKAVKLEIKELIKANEEKLREANKALAAAEKAKTEAESEITSTEPELQTRISTQEQKIAELYEALKTAQESDSINAETQKIDLAAMVREIARQEKSVQKLEEQYNEIKAKYEKKLAENPDGTDNKVKAKMSGVIDSISVVAGETVQEGSVAAVIFISDKGYELEFSVKNDQAKKLRVGDKAEVTSWYWGDEITATLKEIKADTANPQTQKLLVFTVTGTDLTAGQTLNLSMGSKGQSYSAVVPNSAIREDSNGKFVLAMESKSSPLGNRYTAVRYDVEVLAKDDNNSAVNGLMGSEFVITTSNKPISAGEQIRPAD